MKPCPVPEVLLQVLEGKYSRPDQAEVETHLETCPDCQAVLNDLSSFPLPGGPPLLAHPPSEVFLARLCQDHPSTPSAGTPAAPPEAVPPLRLEKYLLLERLEYGGMGIVYRAWDKTLSRFVALKMIRAGKKAAAETRARFLDEARNIAQLQHPNIVTIHEIGEHEGEPFLAMEYLGGKSLAHLLRQGPLPPDQAVDMAHCLARAVQAAHDKKIVHRDLKPANVLLGEDGAPKIIDFGLAKKLGSGSALTHPGALIGTPLYMAPEQVAGRPEEVGPAADIHALGALLYEMLTGQPAFQGTSVSEVLGQVSQREPPTPPPDLRPRIPKKLQAIYRRCLAKEPRQRYPSAATLADDLERFLTRQQRVKGRWLVGAGAVAAAVLFGLGLLYFGWLGKNHPPTQGPGPVKGSLDVQMTRPGKDHLVDQWLGANPAARPLRAGDKIRLGLELKNRPAYLYVIWIDTEGKVLPVFPWFDGDWDKRPEKEEPFHGELMLPGGTKSWINRTQRPGMETVLMLARDAPLPAQVKIPALLGQIDTQPVVDPQVVAYFENGRRVVGAGLERAPDFQADDKDPAGLLQKNLHDKLKEHFVYSRAIFFANLPQEKPGPEKPKGQPRTEPPKELVQEFLRLQEEVADRRQSGHYAQAVPSQEKLLEVCGKLYPQKEYPFGHPELAINLNNLGVLWAGQHNSTQAERCYRQALEMWDRMIQNRVVPRAHPDRTGPLTNLAGLLLAQDNFAQAEELYRQALKVWQALHPPDQARGNREMARCLNQLGLVCSQGKGDYAEAESFYRQSLEMWQRLCPKTEYPQGHEDIARSMNNLGVLLRKEEKFVEAESFLRQSLEMRQRLFPGGHEKLAISLSNLGEMFLQWGKNDQAELYLLQALKMRQKVLPPVHEDTASNLNNLGSLYLAQGKKYQAEGFFQKALEMRKTLFPPEKFPRGHLSLAVSLNNLGALLFRQGEYVLAEPMCRQALEMRRRFLPPDHPHVLQSLQNLGELFRVQGEIHRAEPFFREVLKIRQQRSPGDDPELATCLLNLGNLLQDQGEFTEAATFLDQALKMQQRLYPKEKYPAGHPSLAASLNELGFLNQEQGNYDRAGSFFRQALAMNQKLCQKGEYRGGQAQVAANLNNLGALCRFRGHDKEAEEYYGQTLKIRQALYSPEKYPQGHAELANSLHNLGDLFLARGDFARAEPYLRQAVAMYQALYPRAKYPHGHRNLAASLTNLGAWHQVQGQYAQADPYLRQALVDFQAQATHLAWSVPKAKALNFVGSYPPYRDAFLSNSRNLPRAGASTYTAIWQSRAALTRIFEQRHLSLLTAQAQSPEVRQRYEEWLSLGRRREHLFLEPAPMSPQALQEHLRRLDELNGEIERCENDLANRLPLLGNARKLASQGPADLQKHLPNNAVFIDLLRYHDFGMPKGKPGKGTPSYAAFVVSRDQVQRVDLAMAGPIESAVYAWRRALQSWQGEAPAPMRRDLERQALEQGQILRRLVWEPLARHFPKKIEVVYLAADGALTQMPWAALPGLTGETVLLEDYALALVPHGPFLLDQLTASPFGADSPQGILLLGNVAFDDKVESSPALARVTERAPVMGEGRPHWSDLAWTDREIRQVKELARGQTVYQLTGGKATAPNLLADLPRVRQAHVATHGFFADPKFRSRLQLAESFFWRDSVVDGETVERIGVGARNPLLLSGLVLAGANRPETPGRGILTADAIAGLNLTGLNLVVLSACETGLGEVAGGEGVYSLQRAFHMAGTRNVMASLWRVGDEATAALMIQFYRNLWQEKLPPLAALRRAQLALYRHPELITSWARGERGPDLGSSRPRSDKEAKSSIGSLAIEHSPVKSWAGFILSGLGH